MPLNWVNIRSGETLVSETEPQTAALWASSDHSPNITQGQDFGWRLAPEVVVEMKKIKQSFPKLQELAQLFNKMIDDLSETDILFYISNKTKLEETPEANVNDYQDEYDAQVRALEASGTHPEGNLFGEEQVSSTTTSTTTKSLEDLRAELAAREATENPTTTSTTTQLPTTASTTTESPSTTTTTTEAVE